MEKLRDTNKFYKELKTTKFFKDNITEDLTNLTINSVQKISNVKIGGLDDDVNYIDFDKDKIIQNSKSLWQKIKDETKYKKIGL